MWIFPSDLTINKLIELDGIQEMMYTLIGVKVYNILVYPFM